MMPGRRWSDGLHQAVEAKEKVHDPEREPDARLDHLPELLPHVQEARRHDRHRRHRGLRVPADLQPRDGGDPDAHARWSARTANDQVFSTAQGEVPGDHQRHQGLLRSAASRCWSAPPRSRTPSCSRACSSKEKLPHNVLNAKQHAREAEIVVQAGPAEDGHHRHQHGGPRHRHRAGRQPRDRRCDLVEADEALADRREEAPRREAARRMAEAAQPGGGRGRPAHHRHRAPRVAPHRQPAARPLRPPGRPGQLALLPVARGPAAADLRRRAHQPHHGAAEDARGRGDRARAWSRARSRTRSARSRRATSTSASSCSSTTTSPTTSAR